MLSRLLLSAVALTIVVVTLLPTAAAQPKKKDAASAVEFTRKEDVIYGRKHGMALTLDVFTPKEKANGRGVIFCVSGGWFSSHAAINMTFVRPMLERGYTVFAVVHGSQPKFTIPEVLEDMHRAVRFIKHHAKDYGVDPDKLGISGGSAGGHLSLMQGNAFLPGKTDSKDPVEQHSSRVAAIACFFPPTDFLNYGEKGHIALGFGTLKNFRAPFDFQEFNTTTRTFEPVIDPAQVLKIAKQISPVYHVTKESAPAFIIHGDADKLVPIQQAELMEAKYKEAGVPFELVVKKDGGHGWAGIDKDILQFCDWFDKHLGTR